jgi:hypothetical protein
MKTPTHGALRFANSTLRRVNGVVEISLEHSILPKALFL